MLAQTPQPPYYAVIFSSLRTDVADGYDDTATRMVELAHEQPGFLGVESARNNRNPTDGDPVVRPVDPLGITVSYWDSLEAIRAWKQQAEHRIAQQTGRQHWYETYKVRICRVDREYGFGQI